MTEFQKLRVGVLQQLNGSFSTGLRVIDERRVPSDHGEVIRVVGDTALENFLAFAFAKSGSLAADNLSDAAAMRREKLVGIGRAVDLAHMKNEVVLLQPVLFVVRLNQRRSSAL